MTSVLLNWAIRFALFLVVVFFWGAIQSYFKYRAPKRHQMHNLRPEDLPGDWYQVAAAFSNQLYSLGFVRTGFIAAAAPARLNVELLIHPQLPVCANVILAIAGDQRHACVELKTRFDDGHAVATLNSPTPSIFLYPENVEIHRAKVDWVRELLNEHLASVQAASAGRVPLVAPQVESADSITDEETSIMMHQVERGLFRETSDGQTLRYTVRGALRCTFLVWRRFSFLRQPSQPAPSPSTVELSQAA